MKGRLVGYGYPEDMDYRDTGCEVSPSCLRCPLPQCKHDIEPAGGRGAAYPRIIEAVRLRAEGLLIQEIAERIECGKSHVYWLLRKARERGIQG